MKIHFKIIVLLLLIYSGCTTKYYVVRHGERLNASDTSSLNTDGLQRAEDLRVLMSNKEIDHIYASTYRRTQQTAQPLANALGKSLVIYSPDTTQGLAQKLERYSGSNILVVGHTDNIPELVELLGNESVGTIQGNDFDNLFIVEVQRNLVWTSRYVTSTTYGAPSP